MRHNPGYGIMHTLINGLHRAIKKTATSSNKKDHCAMRMAAIPCIRACAPPAPLEPTVDPMGAGSMSCRFLDQARLGHHRAERARRRNAASHWGPNMVVFVLMLRRPPR